MSEYQRYEFMTVDRPLMRAQLDEVENLSSHIEATPTYAFIEYHWGDFKHDPIKVLRKYFDGFLYWANWGSPQLALRFPHGILPASLFSDYEVDDYITFSRFPDYDILNIHFAEMEAPDEWTDYTLSSLIDIREELMDGDVRALYIAWLAARNRYNGHSRGRGRGYYGYDEDDEDYDEDDYDEDEDYEYEEDEEESEAIEEDEDEEKDRILPVPANFGRLTEAQRALAKLLQLSEDVLAAAARHSKTSVAAPKDDLAAWIKLLPPERGNDYLLRLAQNEPGLSRRLVMELRELNTNKASATTTTGERVPFSTILAEATAMREQREREERERKEAARLRHLQEVHDHQDAYWHQIEQFVKHAAGANYDQAVRLLIDLRDSASHFKTEQAFYERYFTWLLSYLRRPALIERLQKNQFPFPRK